MKVAIVGAGWAGMAAAIAHAQAGCEVTVFEAARTVGGRARAVQATLPDGSAARLDNGQHILIGAYAESLRLMGLVGVDARTALLRLPLTLQFPDGQGLQVPDLPPPLDALLGIARAKGWAWGDKLALLRTATAWQLRGFRCAPGDSVADLCAALTPRLMAEFIDPLCVSALNTPARQASGQIFLRVLQDSLFSGRGGSNLLLPRADLGALFPEPAARWLQAQGAHQVITGQRVQRLQPQPGGRWQVVVGGQHIGAANPAADADEALAGAAAQPLAQSRTPDLFDHVTLACPSWEASRLVGGVARIAGLADASRWSALAGALHFEAITTVYAHAPGARLAQPMLALRSAPQSPAQFVFDRGQLDGHAGLLAFVVSASTGERTHIEQQVLQQAAVQLGISDLQPVQTVVEKRATFACTPGITRPGMQVLPGLSACGDYVDGPYPATLEGAVLSGTAVATRA